MTEPRMRAGNSDRQAAVDRLTGHFTDGRLDPDEFDDRVGKAYAAKHLDELPSLFVDLPEKKVLPTSAARWPGPDRHRDFGPPGPWSGPARPRRHGAPPILAIIVIIAMLFSFGAMSHGFFPFPLIWVGLMLIFIAGGRRRRHWAESANQHHHRGPWDGYGPRPR